MQEILRLVLKAKISLQNRPIKTFDNFHCKVFAQNPTFIACNFN